MAQISQKDKDLILDLLSRFPGGASLEEILIGISPPISRRTLQYRLSDLVELGLVETLGKARQRRYRLSSGKRESSETTEGIFLSPIAKSILQEVKRPIQERRRVGYHREFLDRYIPNQTQYLSEEIQKKLHDLGKTDGQRPAGTYAKQIFNRLLIDLSWNSSRLEGNTYSLLETQRLIEKGVAASGKDLRETQMILNHKAAIEFLVESAKDLRVSRYVILNIHALLADELLTNVKACGSLRSIPVGIGGSVYQPLEIPQLIDECFEQIINTARQIINPFEQAFFLMVHLPYLQPFEDVNKRVSRLSANLPLIRDNLSPLSFVDVPEQMYIDALLGVYELNQIELLRDVFVWAYERSCLRYSNARRELGEPDPFLIKYRDLRKEIVLAVVKGTRDKASAAAFIREKAEHLVPLKDRSRFMEVVEIDLMSLHEGNIARYRLSLNEFHEWQKTWE